MNVPNILTGVRFVLIPVFAIYLIGRNYPSAVFLFLLAGITDVLDGYIARKYNLITSWGKLADPLADKLMQITALVILTAQGRIPIGILVVVAVKEAFMAAGSITLYKQENYVVSANWYGKMATVVFYFAIVMIIFRVPHSRLYIGIAVLSTLFAFIMYIRTFHQIKSVTQKNANPS